MCSRSRSSGHRSAWVVGMPLGGAAGEASWRLSWIVVPLVLSLAGLVALSRRRAYTPCGRRERDCARVLEQPAVVRWSLGELLAYSGWLGVLVFIGALFVEAHGLSVAATGLALGLPPPPCTCRATSSFAAGWTGTAALLLVTLALALLRR